MSAISINERVAVAENDIEGHQRSMNAMQNTLEAILKTIKEIEKQMAKDKSFFAGMAFAYGSIGILGGATVEYFFHKLF